MRIGNRWLVLIAMTSALSMIMLDQTVVAVALPAMGRDLGLSGSGQQWVINAYVLAMAALVAFGGRLGTRIGPVTCFVGGVTLFAGSSLACAMAPVGSLGEAWIIAARASQGVGAALMMPVTAALVMAAFPGQNRGKVMAIYAGIAQVFLAIGPLLGGTLTEHISWRAVFWVNLPIAVAGLVLVWIARPANARSGSTKISVPQLMLLVAGLTGTVFALQESAEWGLGSPRTLLLLGASVLLTGLFVLTQLRTSSPLVKIQLLRQRSFLANCLVAGSVQFGLLATVLFTSIYFQSLLSFSPMLAGVAVLPFVVPIALAAQLGGAWYDRCGVRAPVLAGVACAAAGSLLRAVAMPELSYALQVPGMILMGIGIGLTISPNNTDALGGLADRDRSQGSGISQTFRNLGGALGVAVIGSLILNLKSHATSEHGVAVAIGIGFAAAAAAFMVAFVIAAVMFVRGHSAARPDADAPTEQHRELAASAA